MNLFILRKNERINAWDSITSEESPEKIKSGVLKKYIQRANLVERISFTFTNKINVLEKLELITDEKLTNAARVYFYRMPHLHIQMAVFATREKSTFIDISRGTGSVPEMIAIGEDYIKKNIRWRVVIEKSMQRDEIPEIPVVAIREALMNSFCHRNYRSTQNNEIAIYSDRVEIYNPGTFPEELSPQEFIKGGGHSIKRNPKIADLMYYVKDIENFGTGIKKISDTCRNAGVKVEFRIEKLGFSVIFYREEIHQNIEPEIDSMQTLSYEQRISMILEFCVQPRTLKEIQDFAGIKTRQNFSKMYLTPLLNSGKLRMTHPDNPNDKR